MLMGIGTSPLSRMVLTWALSRGQAEVRVLRVHHEDFRTGIARTVLTWALSRGRAEARVSRAHREGFRAGIARMVLTWALGRGQAEAGVLCLLTARSSTRGLGHPCCPRS